MRCRIVELRHKEVISAGDGTRLGFVDDVEVDTCSAKLVAIVIYGRFRFLGSFGKRNDITICWENIKLIGEDTILVDYACPPRKKRRCGIPLFK